jgi:hypothetical protein
MDASRFLRLEHSSPSYSLRAQIISGLDRKFSTTTARATAGDGRESRLLVSQALYGDIGVTAAVALQLKPGFALYIFQWFSGI